MKKLKNESSEKRFKKASTEDKLYSYYI